MSHAVTVHSCSFLPALVSLTLLLVTTAVNGFRTVLDSSSQSHWDITEKVILKITAEACRDVAQSERRDFTFPVNFILSEVTLQEPIYTDVAKASGGIVLKGSKATVYPAILAFLDHFSSNVVTLLQAVRNPGKEETFPFYVNKNERNHVIFITGTSKLYALTDPSGNSPKVMEQTVGDLLTLELNAEAGEWNIRIRSTEPYTLKITAESFIGFFYSMLKPSVRDSYAIETGRPPAGGNGTMMIALFGSDTVILKDVHLVYSSGSGSQEGSIRKPDNPYIVDFKGIPSEEFSVMVNQPKGTSARANNIFHRQSTTNFKASSVSVTVSSRNKGSFTNRRSTSTSGSAAEMFVPTQALLNVLSLFRWRPLFGSCLDKLLPMSP